MREMVNLNSINKFKHFKPEDLKNQIEQPSIKFQNVSAVWSPTEFAQTGQEIIKNISFEFSNNEKVAIIGRVGCGKTTLLNTILKETFIQTGQIEISGTELIGSYAE